MIIRKAIIISTLIADCWRYNIQFYTLQNTPNELLILLLIRNYDEHLVNTVFDAEAVFFQVNKIWART